MNQKLSWTLLAGGFALFLFQVGDLIAHHSTWSEVLSPAGTGDILRTLGGALLAVFGAIGVRFDVEDRNAVSAAALKNMPVVLLAAALALGSSCASIHGAPITPTPTPDQQAQARADAIKIELAIETGVDLDTYIVTQADALEKAGAIPTATLVGITAASQTFSAGARQSLTTLRTAATNPSLLTTTKAILDLLAPVLSSLDSSGNAVLRALGASLRLATSFLSTYAASGGAPDHEPSRHPRRDRVVLWRGPNDRELHQLAAR